MYFFQFKLISNHYIFNPKYFIKLINFGGLLFIKEYLFQCLLFLITIQKLIKFDFSF